MARARNIKPGFFRNPELVELPFETRLLFPGLWVLADRMGRLEDRPKLIKMEIFPADSVDVDEMLNQLQQVGLIHRYTVEGKNYIEIINFLKHQNPHKDEKPSTIPTPDQHGASTVPTPCLDEVGTNPTRLIPDSLNLIPDSLNKNIVGSAPPDEPIQAEFEEAWALYPQRPGRSKADALRAWRARIKEGVMPALLVDGVKRYSAYCRGTNTEPQYVKQPATFFGPGQHYLSDWTIPSARASPRNERDEARREVVRVLTGNGGTSNANERDITGEAVRVA